MNNGNNGNLFSSTNDHLDQSSTDTLGSSAIDSDHTNATTDPAPTKPKKEPWRIVVFILAVLFIVWTWSKKNVIAIYSTMPKEQVLPLIATTFAVSLVKVGMLAGVIFFVKWACKKFFT